MSNKKEIVLLTGGTGAIGKIFTKALVQKGYRVVILSRSKTQSLSEALSELKEQVDLPRQIID